ncbi:hypothetical protein Tco_1220499 [Tanacetum coccineum]
MDDPLASLNKAIISFSFAYSSRYPPTNNQLRTLSNLRTQATIQNGQVTIQNVQGANQPRDKMLFAQEQEARVVLNDEQQDFLADNLEENDESTANAIFMTNLSHVGSINDDTVEPCYDFDILSSNNESYDELTSNNNVISYGDYMVTLGNDVDNYVPTPVQNNDMILFVIEQIKSQVEKCNTVNQETQSVNESLIGELEHYKERVKSLENESKTLLQTEKHF